MITTWPKSMAGGTTVTSSVTPTPERSMVTVGWLAEVVLSTISCRDLAAAVKGLKAMVTGIPADSTSVPSEKPVWMNSGSVGPDTPTIW